MHRADMRWNKHKHTHTHTVFHSSQYLCPVTLKEEQYLTMSRSSFFFFCCSASYWQPASVREKRLIWGQIVSLLKATEKKIPWSLSASVCVLFSVFLSNLKWQEMKSAVICVDWDRIKNSLVCKGWKDRCYIGLDSSKMQMLILSCHFVLLFSLFSFFFTPHTNSHQSDNWCEFAFYEWNIRQGSCAHHPMWLNEMWYIHVCVGQIALRDVTRLQGNCNDTFCCVRVFICQTPCDPTSSRRKALTLG